MELVGREDEQKIIKNCLLSSESKLIAVYGRRRVGKTFFIRKYLSEDIRFEIAGLHEGEMADQLTHVAQTLIKHGYYAASLSTPKTWMQAFDMLAQYIDSLKDKGKKVIFIDEMPWFDTPRSKFLMAFESFWNSYCTKRNDLVVIICGSAASWISKKILQNKGGLHNRVAEKIKLNQFTLFETEKFLMQKGINWSRYDIAQLYLTTGGIPFYLDAIHKGENVVEFINRACFNENGVLYMEYEEIYTSLFNNSYQHQLVVEQLAKIKQGLTRDQIIAKTKLPSGGSLSEILDELEKSGFIEQTNAYNGNITKLNYKLVDNFTLFYFKYMLIKNKRVKDNWAIIAKNQSWVSWSGFAFERLVFAHIKQIRRALRLDVVANEVYTWSSKEENGAQIDMLIDRADRIINVCEIKFTKSKFEIDKSYANILRTKIEKFSAIKENKNKSLFLTFITTAGLLNNQYYKELVQNEVTLNDLFLK
jgi:uncharacterized protein